MTKIRFMQVYINICYNEPKFISVLFKKYSLLCGNICSALTLLFLLSCAAQETTHGNQIDKVKIDKIQIGITSKKELKTILGPPSFEGSFDSGKLYYSKFQRQSPLGRQSVINSSELFVFAFDDNDILLEMDSLQELPSSIDYDADKTDAPGVQLGILEQIFFNLQRRQNTE